jgi:hypothetical protein
MPSCKIDVHVRRTMVRGELLKTAVHLPQLLSNVDIFGAQFAERAKLSTDRHLPHVAERLAPMTASGTPRNRREALSGWWKHPPREAWIRLWRTGAEDRCGVRCAGRFGPQRVVCRHEQNAATPA